MKLVPKRAIQQAVANQSPWSFADALLPANDYFWGLCYSHYLYPAFLAALNCGLPAKISTKPMSLANLARSVGLPSDAVVSLLPTLLLFGAARQKRDGTLFRGRMQSRWTTQEWVPMFRRHLATDLHVLRQMKQFSRGKPGCKTKFWRSKFQSTRSRILFLESLDAHSQATSRIVANEIKRSRCAILVDIGAGPGTYSFAALQRCRRLRAIVVDQLAVVRYIRNGARFRRYRARIEAADVNALTQQWPVSGNVYLLSHFLQDFGGADRRRILMRASDAIAPGAELWIHGHYWRTNLVSPTHAAFSFYLYCHLRGGLLGVDQQVAECKDAGFRFVRSVPTSATQQILVFAKQ